MENQETQPTAPVAPAELTVTDLQNIRSIIDAASRRGAFQASEMAGVGAVYNKLDAFLNSIAPAQPEQQPEQPPAV
jgi:hypothetical protein